MVKNYSNIYIKFFVALTIIFATAQTYTYAMPGAGAPCVISGSPTNLGVVTAGDDCASAGSLGALDVPCACDGGTIVPTQVSGSTVGATAEDPYGTIINCGGIIGNDMASPAADVWYTFDVSGNSLNLDIVSTMSEISIGIYSDPGGGCGSLIPQDCANDASGSLSTVFENIVPGMTIYLQISGADETDFGDFTLTLSNDVSCFACILENNLTVNPPPINGTYQGGQTVDFCYSITDFSQENTNWLHGIVPVFGSGWDLGTLVVSPPGTCEPTGGGTWGWFTNIPTPSDGNVDGFFFDGDQINGPPDGDPTNNYGDDCGAGSPNGNFIVSGWDFCWSINAQDCIEGGDLGINILNYADGETGSWTDLACEVDFTYSFASSITCCPISIVSSTPTCAATCDGTATVDGLGALGAGAGPWDYTWENASGIVISSNTNVNGPETLINLCAGTYTITVTDNNGCVTVIDVIVGLIPTPTLTLNNPAPVCSPATVDITAGAISSTDVGTIAYYTDVAMTIIVPDATAVGAGTYYVEATNSGCTANGSIVVTVNTTPVIAAGGFGPFTCNATDGNIEVTLSAGSTSSGVLVWTGTTGGSNSPADVTLDSPDITGLGAGSYNVTFTDANGCVSNTEVLVLNNPGAPVIDPISDTVSCGIDFELLDVDILGTLLTGGQGYYTASGGVGPIADGTMYTSLNTPALIYVYDNNGSCASEVQFNITVNVIPTLTLNNPAPVCSPLTVDITAGAVSSTDVGTMLYYSDVAMTILVADATAVGAGTYYVEATNAGCTANGSITVTVNTTPTITFPLIDPAVCSPLTVDITLATVASTDIGTLSYYTDAGLSIPVADPTAVGAGIYYVEATSNGCSSNGSVTAIVTITPTLTFPLIDPAVCSPATVDITVGTVASTDIGTLSYYTDAGLSIPVADPTAVGAGIYYVEATNNGCSSNGSVTAIVSTTPTLTLADPAPVCSPLTVDITAGAVSSSDVGAMLYYSDVAMTILVPDATAVGDGTYYIEATNSGCASNGSVTVIVVTTPEVDPHGPITACDTYTLPVITGLNLTGTEAYYDAAGGLGNVVTAPITSSTTLFIYDGVSGCSDEQIVVITINPLPTVTVVSGGDTYCEGDAVSDILVDVTGTANFTVDYTLDGAVLSASGTTNPLSLGNAAGVYIITNITDGNTCTNGANGSQTIVVNPIPSAPLAGTDSEYCSTVEPNLMTVSGGAGTYTWYSDASLTSVLGTETTLNPSTSLGLTTYYVTETEFGCEGPSSQVNISIIGCEITIPTAFTPDGDLMNDDWEIVDLDLTYPNNIVYVYNRWGNLLFTSEQGSYDSRRWDGTSKEELLPVGSYYFIIEFNDKENKTATGVVSIILNK